VLDPPALRTELVTTARALLDMYADPADVTGYR
jgi:hypothetical protein